eukprot:TRINITY_DN11843_c0_g1_i1.p1 TRINITY_DN11843_c0_g1~~TRINITY_DN11843_c0_g1_i1.p1  ORF type:complete len:139 (-),score=21.48 TRINITY_DN11843_c0_g1_i1:51-467(-)
MNLLEKTKLVGQQASKGDKCCGSGQFVLGVLCCLLSPAVVAYHSGFGQEFLINLLLFICGWLPGVVHGWYVIMGSKIFRRLLWSLVAMILPPLVVGHKEGFGNKNFLFSIIFTICGWFPGILHAWYIIWTYSANRQCF